MQLISKVNRRFRFLLCVIDIYYKYAYVIPRKDSYYNYECRKFWKNLIENQTKYGLLKAVNFIIDQWNHG